MNLYRKLRGLARETLSRPTLALAARVPFGPFLALMRRANRVQITTEQLDCICREIRSRDRCRLLVFGLGNDSRFWESVNRSGTTLFLEDNAEWLENVSARLRRSSALVVQYDSKRTEWQDLLQSPERLAMSLPETVTEAPWDIVLVDAPAGWNDDTPGRMKSIFAATELVKRPGHVFVHDCNRLVEREYCDALLKPENLQREIAAEEDGTLRHYALT